MAVHYEGDDLKVNGHHLLMSVVNGATAVTSAAAVALAAMPSDKSANTLLYSAGDAKVSPAPTPSNPTSLITVMAHLAVIPAKNKSHSSSTVNSVPLPACAAVTAVSPGTSLLKAHHAGPVARPVMVATMSTNCLHMCRPSFDTLPDRKLALRMSTCETSLVGARNAAMKS